MKDIQLENPQYQGHVQQYGHYLKVLNYAETSVEKGKSAMTELFIWLEKQEIYQLPDGPQAIEDFMGHLRRRPNLRIEGKGLSEAHLAKYWQAIRNFDQYLRQTAQGGLSLPERNIRNTPVNKRDIGQILTQTEITLLYQACDTASPLGLRDRAMLSLFYGCGLRRKEGLSLQVCDLKFSDNLVHVREGKFHKERYVPMGKQVKDDLHTYLFEARPYLLRKDPGTILVSQRSLTPTGDTLKNRLKHLQKQSGNPQLQTKNIGLHLLRHSIATHLLQQGMSLKRIAQFLGHTHLESTQIYTHLATNGNL